MKPKPPCPECGIATLVKTDCGSSKGMYSYICLAHDPPTRWNQVPPHMQTSDASLRVRMKPPSMQHVRSYRCGKCGVSPKKGHVCLGSKQKTGADMKPSDASRPANMDMDDPYDDIDDDLPRHQLFFNFGRYPKYRGGLQTDISVK